MDSTEDCDDWNCAPAAAGDQLSFSNNNSGNKKKQFGEDDWGSVAPVTAEHDWDINFSDRGDDAQSNPNAGFGSLGGPGRSANARGREAGTFCFKARGFERGDGDSGAGGGDFASGNADFGDGASVRNGGGRGRRGGAFSSRFGRDDNLGSEEAISRSSAFGERGDRSFGTRNTEFGDDDGGFGCSDGRGARGRGNFRGGGTFGSRKTGFGAGDSGLSGGDIGAGTGEVTERSSSSRGRGGFRGGFGRGRSSSGLNTADEGGFGGGFGCSFGKSDCFGGFDSSNKDSSTADNTGFGSGIPSGFGSESSRIGRGSKRAGEGSSLCYNCGESGHQSRDCTSSKTQNSQDNSCYNCGAVDHISRECPNPPRVRRIENDEVPRKPPSTFVPKDEDVEVLFKDHIEQGEMFTKLFEANVTLTEGGLHGRSEKGKTIKSFDELELTEQLAKNVVSAGYKYPTPIQQYAMPAIFKGRDIMACAQTGSGKTAAFLLPVMTALMRAGNLSNAAESTCCPRCVIIAPTRELAVQIYNEGRKFAYKTVLHVACCYGGTSVMAQRQSIRGATILVATVGRLKHFISEGYISLREVKYLILDEADRMLELGFEDSMNTILNHPSLSAKEERQTFMFSATFPSDVQVIAAQQLKPDFLMIQIGKIGVANKCITQEIIECTSVADKKEKFFELLNIDLKNYEISKEADVFKKKTMVFVSRKLFADTLGVLLSECGIPSTTIHGDRIQNQRSEAINEFKRGKKPVLIATAVGERGLDIKGVDHVINYDLPTNGQDYVHRIGRTGRVGNPGRATSLYLSEENKELAQSLVEILTEADQDVPEFLANDANRGNARFGGFSRFGGDCEANNGGEEEDWD